MRVPVPMPFRMEVPVAVTVKVKMIAVPIPMTCVVPIPVAGVMPTVLWPVKRTVAVMSMMAVTVMAMAVVSRMARLRFIRADRGSTDQRAQCDSQTDDVLASKLQKTFHSTLLLERVFAAAPESRMARRMPMELPDEIPLKPRKNRPHSCLPAEKVFPTCNDL